MSSHILRSKNVLHYFLINYINNDVKTIIVEPQAMTIFSINYCVVYCLRKNVLCMFRDPKVKSANCFFSLSKTQRFSIRSDRKQRRLLDHQKRLTISCWSTHDFNIYLLFLQSKSRKNCSSNPSRVILSSVRSIKVIEMTDVTSSSINSIQCFCCVTAWMRLLLWAGQMAWWSSQNWSGDKKQSQVFEYSHLWRF